MLSSFEFASRNQREVDVVHKLGFKVTIVDFTPKKYETKNFPYHFIHQTSNYSNIFVIRRFQLLIQYLIKQPLLLYRLNADVISCQDIHALFIAYIATVFRLRKKKPKLIYDAHEFELGDPSNKGRNFFKVKLMKIIEKYLINRSSLTIVVNELIAQEMKNIHKLNKAPVVVRNIPSVWSLDIPKINRQRKEYLSAFGVQEQSSLFIMVYHGGIIENRGIECLIRLLKLNLNLALVIIGYGNQDYKNELSNYIKNHNVIDRILFYDAVPLDELRNYISAADVGMILANNISLNNYFMSPNKLFENIQSETPIISSDFPFLRKIIQSYEVGVNVNQDNDIEVNLALEKMRLDRDFYENLKQNLKKAKLELSWEIEQIILRDAYLMI